MSAAAYLQLWVEAFMERAQRLVYPRENALADLCCSLSCWPVMEVGWNVKLPVNVCTLHRCCPTSPARQDGWGSVLPLQNIWFLFAATRERGKKKMNEEGFLEAGNGSRDKLGSGSRQTAVLFNASCCLVDGDLWPGKAGSLYCGCGPQVELKPWVFLNIYSGKFLTTITGIGFPSLAPFCC